ncbi:daunorubicin ABC transporter permease, partial [Paenibacillus dendritiformis]|nr:daunorubicin ABC transporter permease [Paenibacillus dendritiformis]
GMIRMKRVVVDLFSGVIVPISFFPGWLITLNEWLPFQAITFLPSSVFTGRIEDAQILSVIGIQIVWFAVLIVPILLMWRAARQRLFVQGG